MKLTGFLDSMWTLRTCASFGGRRRASIMVKSCNTLVHRESGLKENIPDWWKMKFITQLPDVHDNYRCIQPPNFVGKSYKYDLVVPLGDTDTSGRTRHASYVKYFIDNITIASHRNFFSILSTTIQDFIIKRLSMVHLSPTLIGDTLTVECFVDPQDEMMIHCFVSKDDLISWYGCLEYYQNTMEGPEFEPISHWMDYP